MSSYLKYDLKMEQSFSVKNVSLSFVKYTWLNMVKVMRVQRFSSFGAHVRERMCSERMCVIMNKTALGGGSPRAWAA